MEFEKPEIFNNKNWEKDEDQTLSKFKSQLENREIQPIYKPVLPTISSGDFYELKPFAGHLDSKKSKKYIGVKNLKLIDEISKYLINLLYINSLKVERPKIFLLLEEVLLYIESTPKKLDCYLTYKEELRLNLYKRLDSKFVDYIFIMIDINLDEYNRSF